MGWRELARLPSIFAETIKSMKPGEVSAILRSANGLHIVRLNGRRGQNAPVIVIADACAPHPDQNQRARLRKRRTRTLGEARKNDSTIKRILPSWRACTRRTAAPSSGGDLGWLSPGDTVPEFEKAMDALKPGRNLRPGRSPFGWHMIQVIERGNEDMSKQRERLQARASLREQKADEAYQEWLRQLRDKAFVEFRLEDKIIRRRRAVAMPAAHRH